MLLLLEETQKILFRLLLLFSFKVTSVHAPPGSVTWNQLISFSLPEDSWKHLNPGLLHSHQRQTKSQDFSENKSNRKSWNTLKFSGLKAPVWSLVKVLSIVHLIHSLNHFKDKLSPAEFDHGGSVEQNPPPPLSLLTPPAAARQWIRSYFYLRRPPAPQTQPTDTHLQWLAVNWFHTPATAGRGCSRSWKRL